MKSLVLYSSQTGNTQQLAKAIASALPNPTLLPIDEAVPYADYDIVALGYWVLRGMPDTKVLDYIKDLRGAKVILFGTLGAYVHSEHAQKCIRQSEALVAEHNTVLGSFLCMGKVDSFYAAKSRHPMTPERQARLEEAAKHPNQEDFEKARSFILNLLARLP
ncbi:MAG: flavodoxin family protein [Akkermansia sp.]